MRALAILAVSAAFLTLVVSAGANRVTFPGRSGLIVANYYGRGSPGLILISPDKKGQRRIPGSAGADDAAFSPDGRMLAFTRTRVLTDRYGSRFVGSLWVMRLDGTGARRIVDNAGGPAWSPDGESIVFERQTCPNVTCSQDFTVELFVTTLAGRTRHLTHGDLDGDATFSPDGSEIAFASRYGIYLMNTDGTGKRRLTNKGFSGPSWSPDGETIVFDGPNYDIWIIDRNGHELRRLTNNEGPDSTPIFSPDGRRIAFQSNALCAQQQSCTGETPMAIWIMNAAGSGKRRLTTTTGWRLDDWQRPPGTG